MRLASPKFILGLNLVVAAGALVWVLWRNGGPALAVLSLNPSWILLVAFLAMVAVLLTSATWRWRLVLGGLRHPPGFGPLTLYRLAGLSVSMLVPSAKLGGEPVRAYLLVQNGVKASEAMASVAIDRVLDMGAGTVFTVLFTAVLLRHGVQALEGTLAGVVIAASALLAGIWVTIRRLHGGRGVVTAMARRSGLDRWGVVERRMATLEAAERCAQHLVRQPMLMIVAFGFGLMLNLGVLLEYKLLLGAFGLPSDLIAVVAAIFATGAAHSMPVPAGVGVLEGSQMVLFAALGQPAEVGLAVALAVRLRETLWLLPGLVYLFGRGLTGMVLRESVAPRT